MRVILPKRLIEIDLNFGPLFFLAGPVRGGDDWQYQCCQEIQKHILGFHVAIPCRYETGHPLYDFQVVSTAEHFDRQLTWERHYLNIAGRTGCIIFWLPAESKINPRSGNEPYAMDTRGELGEWRGRLMNNQSLRLVIGADSSFPGLSQIQRNFSLALGGEFQIHKTLPETVFSAIELIR